MTPSVERFVSISSGGDHTCGLRNDGSVFCWGANIRRTLPENERFTFDKYWWIHLQLRVTFRWHRRLRGAKSAT